MTPPATTPAPRAHRRFRECRRARDRTQACSLKSPREGSYLSTAISSGSLTSRENEERHAHHEVSEDENDCRPMAERDPSCPLDNPLGVRGNRQRVEIVGDVGGHALYGLVARRRIRGASPSTDRPQRRRAPRSTPPLVCRVTRWRWMFARQEEEEHSAEPKDVGSFVGFTTQLLGRHVAGCAGSCTSRCFPDWRQ